MTQPDQHRRIQHERVVAAARAESRANLRAHQDCASRTSQRREEPAWVDDLPPRAADAARRAFSERPAPRNSSLAERDTLPPPAADVTALPTNVQNWRTSEAPNPGNTEWFR